MYFVATGGSVPLIGQLLDFFARHLVFGVLLGSALWFFGGYWDFKQGVKHGKEREGFFWAGVGIFIAAAYSVAALFARLWLDSLLAAAGAGLQAWHWKHWRHWVNRSSANVEKVR